MEYKYNIEAFSHEDLKRELGGLIQSAKRMLWGSANHRSFKAWIKKVKASASSSVKPLKSGIF